MSLPIQGKWGGVISRFYGPPGSSINHFVTYVHTYKGIHPAHKRYLTKTRFFPPLKAERSKGLCTIDFLNEQEKKTSFSSHFVSLNQSRERCLCDHYLF